ncbi:MAG: MBL fold metallo-hydrolase [Rhodospirillaceae bacterium]|nr:MBL fold metallo-hydrolase [Rhodospirillaceae bacterium]
MRLTFIGSGSAFVTTPGNFHSNMLFETPDPETGVTRRLLFDCGSDVRWGLSAMGLDYAQIDAVFISHLHNDHIGGLEWLGFKRYFLDNGARIPMFLPEPLRQPLWDNCLRGGMEFLEFGPGDLSNFFDVTEVATDDAFTWMGARFQIVPLVHLRGGGYLMWSYGVFLEAEGGGVLLTSDCRFEQDRLDPWYNRSALIFQDCEILPHPTGAHVHYRELLTLDASVRSRMWLYHINNGDRPDAVADGFLGYVVPGQSFDLGHVR